MVWEADWFVKLQKTNIIVEIATHGVLWVNQDLKVTFELSWALQTRKYGKRMKISLTTCWIARRKLAISWLSIQSWSPRNAWSWFGTFLLQKLRWHFEGHCLGTIVYCIVLHTINPWQPKYCSPFPFIESSKSINSYWTDPEQQWAAVRRNWSETRAAPHIGLKLPFTPSPVIQGYSFTCLILLESWF